MKKIMFPSIICFILIITACPDPYIDPNSIHTVTFSAEGGTFSNAADRISIQTDAKGRISNLPVVTRTAYSFEGWFTTGGTLITAQTVFHDNTLVIARWINPNAGQTDERSVLAKFLEGWLSNPPNYTAVPLNADETLGPQSLEVKGLTSPIEIVLDGTPDINTITLSGFGALFTVGDKVTLRLRNIRLRGHGTNTESLIDIKEGGRVIIEDGTVLTNNYTESLRHGGAVTVNIGGTLNMTGGLIIQNTSAHMSDWLSGNIGGGGVWVRGGTFTMSGGRFEENSSIGGGAVLVTMGGEFTFSAGEMYKNFANSVGGGVRVAGYRSDAEPITQTNPDGRRGSKFTMTGGKIYEGEASSGGGVEVGWHGTFTMTGGEIYKNVALSGGGIYNLYGVVLLYNGKVSENKSLSEAGGLMNAGHCEMWGGEISNNESLGTGGGVMHSPTGSGLLHNFFMYGGSITGNTAQGGGGGLYTIASFDMYGGEISGNTAYGIGGGVLVGSPGLVLDYGELTITDGTITNNTSHASGEPSANLAVRGLGRARIAQLGIYSFTPIFQETITEFTPSRDANGGYLFNTDGTVRGTSAPSTKTFTGGTAVPNVPVYIGHKDEDGIEIDTKTIYFISTPLNIPAVPPVTYEDRSKVQGSFRIAIGDPRVERITETQPVAETFEVIVMDMDAAKLKSNLAQSITVRNGVVADSTVYERRRN